MLTPRWYQKEAVEAVFKYFTSSPGHNPLIVCPTGAGKSLILSKITERLVDEGRRILIISHVEQIILQNYKTLVSILPKQLIGIYAASLNKRQRKQVTVASINSMYSKSYLFKNYTHIIIDEAHTIPHSGEGRYRTLLTALSSSTVIGLTATPFRSNSGCLVNEEGSFFDSIVYNVAIERLISEGYLSPLLTKSPINELDTTNIKLVAGDYSKKELSDRFDQKVISRDIIKELTTYREKYKSWLIFAIDISHALHLKTLLKEQLIICEVVHSKQSKVLNRQIISDFKQGKYQALISIATLTTGFDHPDIDLIALIRPTKSIVLHIQMIGRGLRKAKKEHCLILDFAGNIMRLGPINDVTIKRKGNKTGGLNMAPIKMCPECRSHVPVVAKKCYVCGHFFKIKTKLKNKASELKVIKDKTRDWLPVRWATYSIRGGKNGRMLKITYDTGIGKNNFIVEMFYRKQYSVQWWESRKHTTNSLCPPKSFTEMVKRTTELRIPKAILVDFTLKQPIILDYSF